MNDLFFFKLKKNYFSGFEVFEIAKSIIGMPVSMNYDGHIDGFTSASFEWRFQNAKLTIDKRDRGELEIKLETESSSFFDDSWKIKFKQFQNEVSKPWSDWTEEEILCDPMWIYFFFESNRDIPERFHNAMVLYSYQNTKNTWIKRYFNVKNKESLANNSC
jgi:hypothetical protein